LSAAAATVDERPLPGMLEDVLDTLAVDGRKDDTVILALQWTS
jgi:hypothetical protein